MKKIDLGQTLSIAANVGVIAGLVLVALELRKTTDAIMGATYEARANSSIAWNLQITESETRAPMLMRYIDGGKAALSPEERMRMTTMLVAGYQLQDARFYQYELGLFDDEYYETVFKADMEQWVPRWRDWGLLEPNSSSYLVRSMRPSFMAEIEKYIDAEEIDTKRFAPQ